MSNPVYPIHVVTTIGQDLNPILDLFDDVSVAKQKIADAGGVPPSLDEIIFESQVLADDQTLDSYGVGESSVLQVNVRSGVVTYPMTDALTPPLGAAHLAHLTEGSTLRQQVSGIVEGTTYRLDFYARGAVTWTVDFRDVDDSYGTQTDDVVGPGADLTAFGRDMVAPVGATFVDIWFAATGPAMLFDLVSFRAT